MSYRRGEATPRPRSAVSRYPGKGEACLARDRPCRDEPSKGEACLAPRPERYCMWTNPFTSEAIRMSLKGTLALGDDDTHRPGTVVVRVALVGDIVHAGAIVVGVRTCWRRQ